MRARTLVFWSNFVALDALVVAFTDWGTKPFGWRSVGGLLMVQLLAAGWAFMVAFSDPEAVLAAATVEPDYREHWKADRHGRLRLMRVESVGQLPPAAPSSFAPEQLSDEPRPLLMDPDIGHMPPT